MTNYYFKTLILNLILSPLRERKGEGDNVGFQGAKPPEYLDDNQNLERNF